MEEESASALESWASVVAVNIPTTEPHPFVGGLAEFYDYLRTIPRKSNIWGSIPQCNIKNKKNVAKHVQQLILYAIFHGLFSVASVFFNAECEVLRTDLPVFLLRIISKDRNHIFAFGFVVM